MTGKNENVNYKPMVLLSAMFIGIVGSGFMAKEDVPVQNVPSIVQQKENMKLFVEAPIEISAGDVDAITRIVNTVMKDQIPAMVTPVLKSKDGTVTTYQIGDYEATLENLNLSNSGEQEIFVSIQKAVVDTKLTNDLKLNTVSASAVSADLKSDLVNTYKLKVSVVDRVAPVIEVTESEVLFTVGDEEFDDEDYFVSATDNVDGDIDHSTNNDVNLYEAGEYTITYTAADRAGNETVKHVNVIVEEAEVEEPVAAYADNSSSYSSGYASGYANGGSVSGSALGQVGQNQDCTSLVSRALAAAGINFRGYPASYLSLGSTVSAAEAQPGDVLYYSNGGGGQAHVAIYLGNGQAVHGGWNGGQTVVTTAYVGSGPTFIHIAK